MPFIYECSIFTSVEHVQVFNILNVQLRHLVPGYFPAISLFRIETFKTSWTHKTFSTLETLAELVHKEDNYFLA